MLPCTDAVGAISQGSKLQWGRPQLSSRAITSKKQIQPAQEQRRVRIVRDAHVAAATWEIDDAQNVRVAAEERDVDLQRSAQAYDPFEEDDRLAQLTDDPFDEPIGESLPEPVDDIKAVEDAVEAEIKRRQSLDDPLGERTHDPLEVEPLEVEDPLPEMDPDDFFKEDQGETDEGRLQLEKDDWNSPDFRQSLDGDEFNQNSDIELTPEEIEERARELAQEQQESEQKCQEELAELDNDRISSIDLSVRVEGKPGEDFPFECALGGKQHEPRQWPQITYNWKAAALCHKPLYFEQVQLERYGHSWGPYVQPIMSGVHFFGTLPVLPYKMGIRTPTECVYTLGYYRPGSCAPYMIEPIPFTWRAALFEGAVATGIPFVVP